MTKNTQNQKILPTFFFLQYLRNSWNFWCSAVASKFTYSYKTRTCPPPLKIPGQSLALRVEKFWVCHCINISIIHKIKFNKLVSICFLIFFFRFIIAQKIYERNFSYLMQTRISIHWYVWGEKGQCIKYYNNLCINLISLTINCKKKVINLQANLMAERKSLYIKIYLKINKIMIYILHKPIFPEENHSPYNHIQGNKWGHLMNNQVAAINFHA